MKKLFFALITATALLSFASCGNSVEDKSVSMFQQMYDAGEANDLETFTKLVKEYDSWLQGLSEEDKKKAAEAVYAWDKDKAEQVEKAAMQVL